MKTAQDAKTLYETTRPHFDAWILHDHMGLPRWLTAAEHTYLIQELRATDGGMLAIVFTRKTDVDDGILEILGLPAEGGELASQIVRLAESANHAGKIQATKEFAATEKLLEDMIEKLCERDDLCDLLGQELYDQAIDFKGSECECADCRNSETSEPDDLALARDPLALAINNLLKETGEK